MALPQVDDVSDFHCVTTWSRFDNHWQGVRLCTIAELVNPQPAARFVICTGHDHEPVSGVPYTTNLPLARAIEDDVLLVHTWEGRPLPRDHGGPCRLITPKLYAWKGTNGYGRSNSWPTIGKGFGKRAATRMARSRGTTTATAREPHPSSRRARTSVSTSLLAWWTGSFVVRLSAFPLSAVMRSQSPSHH